MPHAAAGIVDISMAPGDDMHMKVRNGLATSGTFIETNIEAVQGIAIAQKILRSPDCSHDVRDFRRC